MARHHVVFGLGFGDEGKGTIVDYLARRDRPQFVVRFNGGAQAAHNVVTGEGRHHTFAQYGSGALAGARTFLSRFMIVNPTAMLHEREVLELHSRHGTCEVGAFVDGRALVTTPYHIGLNQLRECILRHGSCGMGIGETMRWAQEGVALRVADIQGDDLENKLSEIRDRFYDVGTSLAKQALMKTGVSTMATAMAKLSQLPSSVANMYRRWAWTVAITPPDWLAQQIGMEARCLFEGAQGVLLDEQHGWAPHHTWSTCTPANALVLLAEAGVMRDQIEVTGVLRAYHTRHGAGPFPTEALRDQLFPETHNGQHDWQGEFRWGMFDARLARYALEVSGRVDGLAITHLDRKPEGNRFMFCHGYEGQVGRGKPDIASAVPMMDERATNEGVLRGVVVALGDDAAPIKIGSYGPTASDKGAVL